MIRHLVDAGYEISPLVGEYGDASRRGGILDVYTLGQENPIRCEFDGRSQASASSMSSHSAR
jgi:transcription-repair coupling factor (superfamily II helicase)